MNYHNYYPTDVLNGEGVRAVLFVAGCNHGCKGCYNESTWNPNSGIPFTEEVEDQIIADLQDVRIRRDGITLSGGDPLHERNLHTVAKLVRRIREECPDKTIWCWTGYTLEEIRDAAAHNNTWYEWKRWEIVKNVDVLVDGRFEQDKYDANLKFRGSWNQKIYHMPDMTDITPDDVPKRYQSPLIDIVQVL